jgi:putative aminopeptidase FrvX
METFKRLTGVSGVPGYEFEVAEGTRKELAGLAIFSYDKWGRIVREKKGFPLGLYLYCLCCFPEYIRLYHGFPFPAYYSRY